jgi:hypothetical protein
MAPGPFANRPDALINAASSANRRASEAASREFQAFGERRHQGSYGSFVFHARSINSAFLSP